MLWSKTFYTTIGQNPTLYDFLAIVPKEISHWKYYLAYPKKCVKPKIFQPTLLPPLYSGMCHITCMTQVNPQMCLSVILLIQQVHPYISHMTQ